MPDFFKLDQDNYELLKSCTCADNIHYITSNLGCVGTGGGECEDPRGDQSSSGWDVGQSEQGVTGGGADHDVRRPSVLHPNPGGLYDSSDDARHSTHAARMPARLCPQKQSQHLLQGHAQLEHADCAGRQQIIN